MIPRENNNRLIQEAAKYLKYKEGNLYWAVSPNPRRKDHIGKTAGCIRKDGYISIKFKNKSLLAHRIVWYIFCGNQIPDVIDHKNRTKSDNRIENLRESSDRKNQWNRKNKASKLPGAAKYKNRWQSKILINGTPVYLGLFNTELGAHKAYMKVIKEKQDV